MCETYNGYANRETWALCSWLNNSQGDQEWALDIAESALIEVGGRDGDERYQGRVIGNALRDAFDAMCQDIIEDPSMRSENALRMLFDIGSLYRVNWDEVGEHFIPSEHGR